MIGLTAGYMQGMVDECCPFFINLAWSIPVLPLMIALAAYSPVQRLSLIILVIGITGWAWGARIKRAQIITCGPATTSPPPSSPATARCGSSSARSCRT